MAGRKSVQSGKKEVDGIVFPSAFQANRYRELKILQAAGEIFDLQIEVPFPLENAHAGIYVRELRGDKVRTYTADATYRETENPEVLVVEESKGRMMPAASLRLSIFKALYPQHDLRIVKQGKRKKRRLKKRA